ncbi:hypothetical protein [Thermococcus chitonophagus]|nr:hypothetical protein [Thermococcus chitonophagus]
MQDIEIQRWGPTLFVEIVSYPSTSPPKFPKFRRARFRLEGKRLIFLLRPAGELSFNIEDIKEVEGITLSMFNPPRKGIKLVLSWGQEVIVSVGKNPLIYDKKELLRLVSLIFGPFIDGATVKFKEDTGTLKLVGNRPVLMTNGGIIEIDPTKIEGEIGEKVRKFLSLLEFLSQDDEKKE